MGPPRLKARHYHNFTLVYKAYKRYIDLVRVGTNPHPTIDLLYNTKINGTDSENPKSTWSSPIVPKKPTLLVVSCMS